VTVLAPTATPTNWDGIVEEHYADVQRWALRLTGNPHDADDLTQETFVRVFHALDRYQDGSFAAWLHRICTNLFLDSVRRNGKFKVAPFDPDTHNLPDHQADPAWHYETAALVGRVGEALRRLPGQYRECVVACDIEGKSYEDAAATLGLKVGTVRSRLHRGRAAMRSDLS
jgi:RNA polymerase sigma-70 factor (ECF subfamily)